jgi:diguanylate cyclase (GGDEF)-like protein/hemerythrin-like metal-binding protein
MFDIDHFKRVNDEFGHPAGDAVLCELVALISQSIRTGDTLFRWGGEEFVVLAAATGYRQAEVMAEALRGRVEQHAFEIISGLTISIGVAEHNGNESADSWFARVDAALYSAKESGRNRVVVDRRGSSDAWAVADRASVLHLVWNEGYECGEATIDAEHRELFVLANALVDASFAKDTAPEPFQQALDRLLAHIERHFADEEALLERHRYTQLDAHKRAHAGLVARARQLRADAIAGQATQGNLIEFLANDVVARHMLSADRDFFSLFTKP